MRFRRKLRIGPQRRFKLFFSLSMILDTDKKIMSSDSLALWFSCPVFFFLGLWSCQLSISISLNFIPSTSQSTFSNFLPNLRGYLGGGWCEYYLSTLLVMALCLKGFLKPLSQINYIASRGITLTAPKMEKILEDLEKNPYYEKYSARIAALQKTSPEEFLQRVEQQQSAKEKEKKKKFASVNTRFV